MIWLVNMVALRIQNVRCLKDTGYLDLKPLTLLVGRNSAGKSSFLRFLPLLKQSMDRRTRGAIRWYGDLVDFGSFGETVHRNGEQPWLGFAFQVDEDFSFELRLQYDAPTETTFVMGLDINIGPHCMKQRYNQDEKLIKLVYDQTDLTELIESDLSFLGFIPLLQSTRKHPAHGLEASAEIMSIFSNSSLDLKDAMPESKIIRRWLSRSPLGANLRYWSKQAQMPATELDEDAFLFSRNILIAHDFIGHFLRTLQVHSIKPIRAHAERSYRWDELDVDSVDASGSNLAMVLSSLDLDAFSAWTLEHFGFAISVKRYGPNVSLYLKEKNNDKPHNLTDTGFGYSQILPVITQLYMLLHHKKTTSGTIYFVMEQPELHLHPQLQALLVDAMVATLNTAREKQIDLRLIMETHSQIIASRIGQHICFRGNLAPEDAAVHLFEKNDDDATAHVRSTHFNEQGMLMDWPLDFFAPDLLD